MIPQTEVDNAFDEIAASLEGLVVGHVFVRAAEDDDECQACFEPHHLHYYSDR